MSNTNLPSWITPGMQCVCNCVHCESGNHYECVHISKCELIPAEFVVIGEFEEEKKDER